MAILCLSTTLWFGCKEKELPGSINGCIIDKATGEPIKTAGVELLPTGIKKITGSEGQYEFIDVEPGVYKLHITKTGYEELVSNEIVVNSSKSTPSNMQLEKLPPSLKIVDDKGEEIYMLDFGSAESDITRAFNIFNDGTESLQWEIITTAEWITSIDPERGNLPYGILQPIIITIDRATLKEDNNVTTIHITSNNGSGQLILKAQGRSLPILKTLMVTNITKTTAVLNGQIIQPGMPSYIERGFVYNTSSLPTIENSIKRLRATTDNDMNFSTPVSDLVEGQTYYVRAYAQNLKGIAYSSNEVSFRYDLSNVFILEELNLMVQKTNLSGGGFSWFDAYIQCPQSAVAGYTDWRLPTIEELEYICENKDRIGGFSPEPYWSLSYEASDESCFYILNMKDCSSVLENKKYGHKVRAVRDITEEP